MMQKGFRLTAILLLLGASWTEYACAQLPVGGTVVSGHATFLSPLPSQLQIQNKPSTVINWQAFNFGAGSGVISPQNPSVAPVLNRIVGVNPSIILGNLQSNGRVLLLDQNGVVLNSGSGAPVAVAGLADASAGKPTTVFLEAPAGSITEVKGASMLAPGKSMVLTDAKNPDVKIEITAPQNRALDVGQLLGSIGNKGIASALTARDTPAATRAVLGENGAIMLRSVQ